MTDDALIDLIKNAVGAKAISTYTSAGGGRYIASGELYDFIREHTAKHTGDASTRKDEGCTGETVSATAPSAVLTSPAKQPGSDGVDVSAFQEAIKISDCAIIHRDSMWSVIKKYEEFRRQPDGTGGQLVDISKLIKAIETERDKIIKVHSPHAPYNWCIQAIKDFAALAVVRKAL